MREYDLTVRATTELERKSFLAEFERSTRVHGGSYDIVEEQGVFQLKLRPNAPASGSLPLVYMDIRDWRTLYKEPSSQGVAQQGSTGQFGVYQSPDGDLWIDGSWQNAYGPYQTLDRNARVEAANKAYPNAKIHACPHIMRGWQLVG
jgi:hypothetical protein